MGDRYKQTLDIENLGPPYYQQPVDEIKTIIQNGWEGLEDRLKSLIENNENKLANFQAKKIIQAMQMSDLLYLGYKNKNNLSPKQRAINELILYFPEENTKRIEKNMKVEEPVKKSWDEFWDKKIHYKDIEKITEFYKTTDAYIYELMAANNMIETLYSYSKMTDEIKELNIKTIHDYGAGIGTLCILLKELGYNVSYSDLDSKTLKFAEWRFNQRNLEIETKKLSIDENGLPKYIIESDLIICTEVLEHITSPEELIKMFTNKSKYLAISESFDHVDEFCTHLPQHEGKGKKFIEYMNKLGYELISNKATPILLFENNQKIY